MAVASCAASFADSTRVRQWPGSNLFQISNLPFGWLKSSRLALISSSYMSNIGSVMMNSNEHGKLHRIHTIPPLFARAGKKLSRFRKLAVRLFENSGLGSRNRNVCLNDRTDLCHQTSGVIHSREVFQQGTSSQSNSDHTGSQGQSTR